MISIRRYSPIILAFLALPATAFAHHLMGGRAPATVGEGLLSGLAHPVIGIDHLLVGLSLGMLSSRLSKGWVVLGAFVLASLAGTALHLMKIDVPAAEVAIAASVVCLGGLLLAAARGALGAWAVLAAGAGVFHGYAYGESILGAEPTPLAAYLLGFTVVQLLLAVGGRALASAMSQRLLWLRAWGGATGLIGIVLVARAIGG